MTTNRPDYHPISCAFHDLLEERATLRRVARVRYLDEQGALQSRSAVITDVFARAGADYMTLGTGETLRLDRIIEVDGTKLADA